MYNKALGMEEDVFHIGGISCKNMPQLEDSPYNLNEALKAMAKDKELFSAYAKNLQELFVKEFGDEFTVPVGRVLERNKPDTYTLSFIVFNEKKDLQEPQYLYVAAATKDAFLDQQTDMMIGFRLKKKNATRLSKLLCSKAFREKAGMVFLENEKVDAFIERYPANKRPLRPKLVEKNGDLSLEL